MVAVKGIHTLVWLSVESCVIYLLVEGFAGRSGRREAVAAGVVAGESLIFAACGFRCPLTLLARHLGAENGSVTGVYLPEWLARNLPAVHVPLIVLAALAHGANLRRRASAAAPSRTASEVKQHCLRRCACQGSRVGIR
jgi:hypothetical protein